MLDVADRFALAADRVWLNCAHQGPLPRIGIRALEDATLLKAQPHRIRDESFVEVPRRMRSTLGALIGVPGEEVVLGNSTSYGLHLLANGFPWAAGDEVIVLEDEFPASVLPWTTLRKRGVSVRSITESSATIDAETLDRAIGPATRVFCASWVNSFTGATLDIRAIGAVCRTRRVRFVVNASQAIGHRTLDADAEPVDALSCCGFKWLCGPYATGFCWIRPDLREQLTVSKRYWLSVESPMAFEAPPSAAGEIPPLDRESRLDVFCPAGFFTVLPWCATIEWLTGIGIADIGAHDDALAERLIGGLDHARFQVLGPTDPARRSPIVAVSHRDRRRNIDIHAGLVRLGFDCALRRGNLRFSPHLYNSIADIDAVLGALADA